MVADVHLVAGLNGSGKTSLARRLASTLPGVRCSLDEWMLRLYGLPFDDDRYPELADRCRELIWDTAAQVLNADVAVILDWNLWSRQRRADAVRRAGKLGADCHLHYLSASLDTALTRAAAATRCPTSRAALTSAIAVGDSSNEWLRSCDSSIPSTAGNRRQSR